MMSWNETGLSLAAGSLTTLSPCVFPLLPLVLGGAAQRHRAAPLAMALGMTLSFSVLGTALTLVATEGGAVRGALILGFFGAGAAIPLVGVAILSGADHWLESRVNDWLPDAWLALTVRL